MTFLSNRLESMELKFIFKINMVHTSETERHSSVHKELFLLSVIIKYRYEFDFSHFC